MDELGARFGANLRAMRRSAGLSQEALADLAGIHRTQVSKFERGENCPSLEGVVKLAGAFGGDFNEILNGVRWIPLPVKKAAIVRGRFVFGPEGGVDA